MLAEFIKPTKRNPITGHLDRTRYGRSNPTYYADVEQVVFAIRPMPGGGYDISPVITHLTSAGRDWYVKQCGGSQPKKWAPDLDHAREVIASWTESRTFERTRHMWQTAEIDTERLAAPYRIAELDPHHFEAIRNDPRGWVFTIGDDSAPIYTGSAIVAEVTRHSPSIDGADYTGWIVSTTHNHSDVIKRKPDALAQLDLWAQGEMEPTR